MDMQVNTEAFDIAYKSLKNHCKNINSLTDFFLKRLERVRQEFDDINYARTMERANNVKKQIAEFSSEVELLNIHLQNLNEIVDKYSNGGYY